MEPKSNILRVKREKKRRSRRTAQAPSRRFNDAGRHKQIGRRFGARLSTKATGGTHLFPNLIFLQKLFVGTKRSTNENWMTFFLLARFPLATLRVASNLLPLCGAWNGKRRGHVFSDDVVFTKRRKSGLLTPPPPRLSAAGQLVLIQPKDPRKESWSAAFSHWRSRLRPFIHLQTHFLSRLSWMGPRIWTARGNSTQEAAICTFQNCEAEDVPNTKRNEMEMEDSF